MPVITMYADASFCQQTGAAGGAFVIKHQDTIVRDRFELGNMVDSWQAEVMTYGYALKRLLSDKAVCGLVRTGAVMVSVLDCEVVFSFTKSSAAYSNKGRKWTGDELSVRELHNTIMSFGGMKILFEHVKSHTNDTTVAAYYNSRVDEEARACMVQMRNRIKKHGKAFDKL